MADFEHDTGHSDSPGVDPAGDGRVHDADAPATSATSLATRLWEQSLPHPRWQADPLPWNPLLTLWTEAAQQDFGWFGARPPTEVGDPVRDFKQSLDVMRMRDRGTTSYAFSVPTGPVIRSLVQHCPRIVEIGAGTGYWAKLLTDAGADVIAIDNIRSGDPNGYSGGQEVGRWYPVQYGDVGSLTGYRDRTLMLAWPAMDDFAARAVDLWRGTVGSHLIFVGEHDGGCCADDEFFAILRLQFEEVAEYELPQWRAIHDNCWIYRRVKLPRSPRLKR